MALWMLEQGAEKGKQEHGGAASGAAGGNLLPSLTTVVQAGAFGAILAGTTTGAVNAMRVKAGEIDAQEAVRETVHVATRGATTMAIASVAAHIVRVYPVFGLFTLLAVGAAAVTMAGASKKKAHPPAVRPRAAVARPATDKAAAE